MDETLLDEALGWLITAMGIYFQFRCVCLCVRACVRACVSSRARLHMGVRECLCNCKCVRPFADPRDCLYHDCI